MNVYEENYNMIEPHLECHDWTSFIMRTDSVNGKLPKRTYSDEYGSTAIHSIFYVTKT